MMASLNNFYGVGEFSTNSRYLCHSDPNGVVKIWDTITGLLKQEYSPSSHLSVQCTCISWAPINDSNIALKNPSPKKKKRKLDNSKIENECELIALGSSDGSILLYNVNEASIHSQLNGGHEGAVTGICWSRDGSKLYSCSADEHIVEWDVNECSAKHKWKNVSGQLTCIMLSDTQEHLLTANESIHLWDLKTRKVVQTFVGHTTEVVRLCEVPKRRQGGDDAMDCDGESSIEGNYIVSMAKGESKISVRQIGSSNNKSSQLLASFSLVEEPIAMNLNIPSSDKQMVQMVVVTRQGKVAYFELAFNGRQKKPIKPKQVTTIVSKTGENEKTLPVVASGFNSCDGSLCLVYEDFILPVFEFIPPGGLHDKLIREEPRKHKVPQIKSKKVMVETHEKEVASITKKKIRVDEMTLGERVAAEGKLLVAKPGTKTIKTDTSSNLLVQGLRSKDKSILNAVLHKTDPTFIRATVSDLPVTHVGPLVIELHKRLSGHAQSGKTAAKWMRALLSLHSSYIKAVPNIRELLEPIVHMLETPTLTLSKLLQLRGRLECFTIQKTSNNPSTMRESSNCNVVEVAEEVECNHTSEGEWEEDDTGN